MKGVAVKAKIAVVVGVFGVLVPLAVSSALAKQTQPPPHFAATLNAAQEVPKPTGVSAMAAGRFTASPSGTILKWTLTFSHLTGPATAAHIHLGVKGKSGPVLIPLCGPCKSPAHGTARFTHAELTKMLAGKTYVNVHTAKNPNGEIRGQLKTAS